MSIGRRSLLVTAGVGPASFLLSTNIIARDGSAADYGAFGGLAEKYSLTTMTITWEQLVAFHRDLSQVKKRMQLDAEPEPIPSGRNRFFSYLEQIYPDLEKPGLRVALLVIHLIRREAYSKREGDVTGNMIRIPWRARDVEAVAILLDRMLNGAYRVAALRNAIPNIDSSESLEKGWAAFAAISSDPYVPTGSKAAYLNEFWTTANANSKLSLGLQVQASRNFAEIGTFLKNVEAVDGVRFESSATWSQAWAQIRKRKDASNALEWPANEAYRTAADILVEQAVAAQELRRTTAEQASDIFIRRFIPAVRSATDLRGTF